GVNTEAATAAEDCVSLSRHEPLPEALFDDCPVVVAGIARLAKQFDPSCRIIVKFGSQHPALEDLLLLWRVIAVDLHEGASARGALNFLHDLDGARTRKIMHRV